MSYLQDITARFPVRKRDEEKEAFRKWAVAQGKTLGYSARVEELARGRHCNVVFGSPEHAQVIYTAHYDTPARLPIPNLMTPRNIPMFALYQLGIILILLLAAVIAFVGAQLLLRNASLSLIIALVVYYALLLLMIAGPANPNNVNDNTSGVAAVLETMARMPKEQRDKAAFILFDNEEKGRLGSRAFAAANPRIKKQTLLINMDCVGVGEHILVIGKNYARAKAEYALLEQSFTPRDGLQPHCYGVTGSVCNSDHQAFRCGVVIVACRRKKGVGFYTTDIHTRRDTQADQKNLDYIAESLCNFTAKL